MLNSRPVSDGSDVLFFSAFMPTVVLISFMKYLPSSDEAKTTSIQTLSSQLRYVCNSHLGLCMDLCMPFFNLSLSWHKVLAFFRLL